MSQKTLRSRSCYSSKTVGSVFRSILFNSKRKKGMPRRRCLLPEHLNAATVNSHTNSTREAATTEVFRSDEPFMDTSSPSTGQSTSAYSMTPIDRNFTWQDDKVEAFLYALERRISQVEPGKKIYNETWQEIAREIQPKTVVLLTPAQLSSKFNGLKKAFHKWWSQLGSTGGGTINADHSITFAEGSVLAEEQGTHRKRILLPEIQHKLFIGGRASGSGANAPSTPVPYSPCDSAGRWDSNHFSATHENAHPPQVQPPVYPPRPQVQLPVYPPGPRVMAQPQTSSRTSSRKRKQDSSGSMASITNAVERLVSDRRNEQEAYMSEVQRIPEIRNDPAMLRAAFEVAKTKWHVGMFLAIDTDEMKIAFISSFVK